MFERVKTSHEKVTPRGKARGGSHPELPLGRVSESERKIFHSLTREMYMTVGKHWLN